MHHQTGFSSLSEGAQMLGLHGIVAALTIAAPMQSFMLAICLHPQYLKPLQAEIDYVLGSRLPVLSDIEQLPYLRACIRGTMRWRPPLPTGIAHELSQDDTYNGYEIRKGSQLYPFEWGMSRNEDIYPHPETLKPESWLDPTFPTYQEPLSRYLQIIGFSQFGWGRRVCTGRALVEADLIVGIGSIIKMFDIGKKDGVDVQSMDYGAKIIAKPNWFALELSPRSHEHRIEVERFFEEESRKGSF